jgi:hypothetical protein
VWYALLEEYQICPGFYGLVVVLTNARGLIEGEVVMRRARLTKVLLVCVVVSMMAGAGAERCEAACPRGDYINPMLDFWSCEVASFIFGGGGGACLPPIAADFFGPGSDPFDGGVYATSHDPTFAVVFQRYDQMVLLEPYPVSDTNDYQLVYLDLQSVAPIVVTYNGGQSSEQWDVAVELSLNPVTYGSLSVTKTHCEGGTYTASFPVHPRFTFVKVSNPAETRVLDTGLEGIPPIDLDTVSPCPWEHSPDGNDFRPSQTCPLMLVDAGGGCGMNLIHSGLAVSHFEVQVDSQGQAQGGGSGFNGGHWYYYPNTDWSNQWFYDHPYDPWRKKVIDVSFHVQPLDPCQPSWATIAYNWSTPLWQDHNEPPLPPLDPADEARYIERAIFFEGDPSVFPDPMEDHFEIDDYNPQWISIDVNGYNFEIIAGFIEHSCIPRDLEFDFGDAPDPNYPTLLASNGARHAIGIDAPWLGPADDGPDPDADGQPDPAAMGDDSDLEGDDEDGVTIPPLTIGAAADIYVEVSGGGGWVYGWVDFNSNGDWDPCEQVVGQFLPDGVNPIPVTAPAGSAEGMTFARFRISGEPVIDPVPIGEWYGGEVEDHPAEILPSPGDDCDNPVPVMLSLGDLPYTNTNTTCGRGDDYNMPCWSTVDDHNDIIYELNITEPMDVNIILDPCSTRDTMIAISKSCPPEDSCIKYSGGGWSADPHGFCVHLEPGTYYITIDHASALWPCIAEFRLTIDQGGPSPPNDECANAELVSDIVDQPFDTTCASFDGPGHCMESPNIWYCYTATCTGNVTVSLCGSSFNTMLAVYNGCQCYPTLVDLIDCNDNFDCPDGNTWQSQVTFAATTGSDYLIEVGGYHYLEFGEGLLSIWCDTACERGDYINPGTDYWMCPDANFVFGAGGCMPALPADFFGPGSDPFDGGVYCSGETPGPGSDPDCIVERTSRGHVPPPYPSSDTIDIEIVALNLVSVAPITVTYHGGMDPEQWDVTVDLSAISPPPGTLSATKTHCNGGTYSSTLPVQPRFTFVKLDGYGDTRILDTGLQGIEPIDLNSIAPCPWQHTPDGNDFRPAADCPLDMEDSNCNMTLVPSEMVGDDFWVQVFPNGYVNGSGSGYNNGHWYYYENTDWWNQWFYDHPFDPNRRKVIDVSFTIQPLLPGQPVRATVAYNWSTPLWPDPNKPPLPPLDPNDEDDYVGRSIFFEDDLASWPQSVTDRFEIGGYNPAWVSIDVNGFNFTITDGWIRHACIAKDVEIGRQTHHWRSVLLRT